MKNNKKTKKKLKLNLKTKRVLLLLFSIGIMGLSCGMFLLYGPISFFRNTLITTAMTTMSHQYLAQWFFTDEYIENVLANNYVVEVDETTNPDLIDMNDLNNDGKYDSKYEKELFDGVDENTVYKMIDVKGTGYDGYVVAIYKPEKVKIAVSSRLGTEGQTVKKMATDNNALVAINASGFYDPTWSGNGSMPHGTVIKDGKVVWDYADAGVGGGFIGFDRNNKLILGRMTKQQALNMGMRDGMEFGPFMIVNGKPSFVKGDGGWGIAPRTAIGQRSDGIVLFVVINGRDYARGVLGIDLVGLTELMQNYGAVNAANLDGGTSSILIEKGNLINNPISSNNKHKVERRVPTAWIVTE